jgi:hypothetical protein
MLKMIDMKDDDDTKRIRAKREKKEQIPLSYPRRLRQRGRGLPCAATLEREKSPSLFSNSGI